MIKKVILIFLCCSLVTANSIVKRSNLTLLNKVIYIDPGHGGRDKGTSYNNIIEKDINLKISLLLRDKLLEEGAIVFLTRDEDIDLSKESDHSKKRGDLNRRIKLIEDSKADMYISIHTNWYNDSKYRGIDVMYNKINKNNYILAEYISNSLNNNLLKVREIKKINDYMYRNINIPGVLVECGFLSNYTDRNLLQDEKYYDVLTDGIRTGIIDYFNN